MRTYIQRVLVRERHVDAGANATTLTGGRYPRNAATDGIAYRAGTNVGNERIAMFVFPGGANNNPLAVTLHDAARAERDRAFTNGNAKCV